LWAPPLKILMNISTNPTVQTTKQQCHFPRNYSIIDRKKGSEMTREEFEELDKKHGGITEDPDGLGVVPTKEHPEWYMELLWSQLMVVAIRRCTGIVLSCRFA